MTETAATPRAGGGVTPGGGGYTVATVARQLGVAPATLRTWDRRYGLGPGAHAAGSRRRYTDEDVALLMHMRQLVHGGIGPGDAAGIALGARTQPTPAGPDGAVAPATADATAPPGTMPPAGSVRAAPLTRVRRAVLRSALDLDGPALERILGRALAGYGVSEVWTRVLVPALTEIGERWARTGQGIEVEHLLSQSTVSALNAYAPGRTLPGVRPLLLAGAEGEWHCLPLYALAAALGEAGRPALMLGPATPSEALASAIDRVGPAAVFVWSARAESAVVPPLGPRPRSDLALILGGPGWAGISLPDRAVHAADLQESLELLGAAYDGPAPPA